MYNEKLKCDSTTDSRKAEYYIKYNTSDTEEKTKILCEQCYRLCMEHWTDSFSSVNIIKHGPL